MLNKKSLETVPSIGSNRKLLLSWLHNTGSDNSLKSITNEKVKQVEGIKFKEIYVILFTDGMILYLESSRTSIGKLFQ